MQQTGLKKSLLLSGLIALALTSQVEAKDESANAAVLATVNGAPITMDDLNQYVSSKTAAGARVSQNPAHLLDEVINRELLKQAALKAGIEQTEDFKRALEAQKTNLLLNSLLSQKIEQLDLSDDALKKEYDAQMKQADLKEYKARHILVKTEQEAKEILAELKKGADFEKLAKEKSTGPSGPNGGDLGWFKAGSMVPEFATAVKQMKPGSVSDKPVKTKFGWHIIKLEETRDVKPPSFEQSKSSLKSIMANQAIQSYIDELRKNAKIDLKGMDHPPKSKTQ